jgi:hypothetical protein
MRDLGTTTSEDIANIIIEKTMRSDPNIRIQDTIRRRIYDVINVLSAAGVIDKVGKQLVWQGRHQPQRSGVFTGDMVNNDETRIGGKEKLLREKIGLLTRYKALLRRNFSRPPKADAISLPVILIGITEPTQASLTQPLDRCELDIRSKNPLSFLSPAEILQRIDLPKDSIREILSASPDYMRYGSHLLQGDGKA